MLAGKFQKIDKKVLQQCPNHQLQLTPYGAPEHCVRNLVFQKEKFNERNEIIALCRRSFSFFG